MSQTPMTWSRCPLTGTEEFVPMATASRRAHLALTMALAERDSFPGSFASRDPITGRFLSTKHTDGDEDGTVDDTVTDLCRAMRGAFGHEGKTYVEVDEVADTVPSPEDIFLAAEESEAAASEDEDDGFEEMVLDMVYVAIQRAVALRPAIAPASEVKVEEFDFVDTKTFAMGVEFEEVVDRKADVHLIAERVKPSRPGRRYENAQRIRLQVALRKARRARFAWLDCPDWDDRAADCSYTDMDGGEKEIEFSSAEFETELALHLAAQVFGPDAAEAAQAFDLEELFAAVA